MKGWVCDVEGKQGIGGDGGESGVVGEQEKHL